MAAAAPHSFPVGDLCRGGKIRAFKRRNFPGPLTPNPIIASVPFVYILRCRDGALYTGIAKNIEQRLAQHQLGKAAAFTRPRRPVVLVWRHRVRTWSAALKEEYRIKQLSRARKEKLLQAAPRDDFSLSEKDLQEMTASRLRPRPG